MIAYPRERFLLYLVQIEHSMSYILMPADFTLFVRLVT